MNPNAQTQIAQFLRNELKKRKQKNPNYSLRAFARDLEINKTTLSFCMLETRQLSEANFEKILVNINVDATQRSYLRSLFMDLQDGGAFSTITPEEAEAFSAWLPFAILDLIPIESSNDDYSWFAKQLNVGASLIAHWIKFLLERGHIQHDVNRRKFVRIASNLTTPDVFPNSNNYQSESLNHALDLLTYAPETGHNLYSLSFCADAQTREKVLRMFTKFLNDVANLETHSPQSKLYRLNMQFFPCKNFKPIQDGDTIS